MNFFKDRDMESSITRVYPFFETDGFRVKVKMTEKNPVKRTLGNNVRGQDSNLLALAAV